uniref:Uncharacterized protein n=1 Tax=Tanacetum cinerariifolium TaxID=118510 RepID=A0A699XDA8_TANCI|nr:hypothetical protein [Tanacetum cinerariifolium]
MEARRTGAPGFPVFQKVEKQSNETSIRSRAWLAFLSPFESGCRLRPRDAWVPASPQYRGRSSAAELI